MSNKHQNLLDKLNSYQSVSDYIDSFGTDVKDAHSGKRVSDETRIDTCGKPVSNENTTPFYIDANPKLNPACECNPFPFGKITDQGYADPEPLACNIGEDGVDTELQAMFAPLVDNPEDNLQLVPSFNGPPKMVQSEYGRYDCEQFQPRTGRDILEDPMRCEDPFKIDQIGLGRDRAAGTLGPERRNFFMEQEITGGADAKMNALIRQPLTTQLKDPSRVDYFRPVEFSGASARNQNRTMDFEINTRLPVRAELVDKVQQELVKSTYNPLELRHAFHNTGHIYAKPTLRQEHSENKYVGHGSLTAVGAGLNMPQERMFHSKSRNYLNMAYKPSSKRQIASSGNSVLEISENNLDEDDIYLEEAVLEKDRVGGRSEMGVRNRFGQDNTLRPINKIGFKNTVFKRAIKGFKNPQNTGYVRKNQEVRPRNKHGMKGTKFDRLGKGYKDVQKAGHTHSDLYTNVNKGREQARNHINAGGRDGGARVRNDRYLDEDNNKHQLHTRDYQTKFIPGPTNGTANPPDQGRTKREDFARYRQINTMGDNGYVPGRTSAGLGEKWVGLLKRLPFAAQKERPLPRNEDLRAREHRFNEFGAPVNTQNISLGPESHTFTRLDKDEFVHYNREIGDDIQAISCRKQKTVDVC